MRLPFTFLLSHEYRSKQRHLPKLTNYYICVMKKMMMALGLCLMSAMVMADNRQVSTALPAQTPSVTVTLDGKQHVVKPTKATIQEVDASHVECIVYAGKDNAKVTLPIAYNTLWLIGIRVAELARDLNLITEDQLEQAHQEYRKQVGAAVKTE